MRKKASSETKILTIPSLQSDRHGLITGHCKICLKALKVLGTEIVHIATSLERLRRKQILAMLRDKIRDAEMLGWTIIPFGAQDLDHCVSDLDF